MPIIAAAKFLECLREGQLFVSDGAVGSELMRLGVSPEAILEANLMRLDDVLALHRAYLDAGAQLLTANTFGLRDGADWLAGLTEGWRLACRAASEHSAPILPMLSLIPTTVMRESGTLAAAVRATEWPVTTVLIETCTSLSQALEASRAARFLRPELLMVTGHFTASGVMPDGTGPETFAKALEAEGDAIVGANCGEEPATLIGVAQRMRQATDIPLFFQPNAGLPAMTADGSARYSVLPDAFAEIARRLFAEGVNIVGGCCGTTPAHIAALQLHTGIQLIAQK